MALHEVPTTGDSCPQADDIVKAGNDARELVCSESNYLAQAEQERSSFPPTLGFDGLSQSERLLSEQLARLAEQLNVRMQRQEDLLTKLSDQIGICVDSPRRFSLLEEEGRTLDVDHVAKCPSFCSSDEEDKERAIYKASQAAPITRSFSSAQVEGRFVLNKWAASMANHSLFERAFCAAIILNTVCIGVQLELTTRNHPTSTTFGMVMNYSFTSIFCLEILIRILAKGWSFFVSNPDWRWDFFDTSIVLISLLEALMSSISKSTGLPGNAFYMRLIRATRVFSRFTRLMRLLRLMRFLRSLRVMLKSLIFCFKSLVWVALIWFACIYMFAILFTSASSEYAERFESMPLSSEQSDHLLGLQTSFGTLTTTMRTLYESVTGGHDWGQTADLLKDVHSFWMMLFLFYQFFSSFALMNVITGVFCNGAIEGAQQDHNEVLASHVASGQVYVHRFEALFRHIDTNNNGTISVAELEQHLNDAAVQAYFLSMDIHPHEAWTLLSIFAESSSEIECEEFVLCCMRFRGNARAVDLASISYQNKSLKKKLRHLQTDMRTCRKEVQDVAKALERKMKMHL